MGRVDRGALHLKTRTNSVHLRVYNSSTTSTMRTIASGRTASNARDKTWCRCCRRPFESTMAKTDPCRLTEVPRAVRSPQFGWFMLAAMLMPQFSDRASTRARRVSLSTLSYNLPDHPAQSFFFIQFRGLSDRMGWCGAGQERAHCSSAGGIRVTSASSP